MLRRTRRTRRTAACETAACRAEPAARKQRLSRSSASRETTASVRTGKASSKLSRKVAQRFTRAPWESGRLLLREFLVPQRAAQNLADIGLRQLIAELDDFRHLVARQVLAAMRDHLFGGQRRIALHDEHFDALALRVVGHTDCRYFAHVGVRRDHV